MKRKMVGLVCFSALILGSCAQKTPAQDTAEYIELDWGTHSEPTTETAAAVEPATEIDSQSIPENDSTEKTAVTESGMDDTVYIGEYLDADYKEPCLKIAKGGDGKYLVQIAIIRLTSLDDGIGELTAEGMRFTATDASGNPISGMITVKGDTAVVTFTDSTWSYLPNGSAFEYTKSSDVPNITQSAGDLTMVNDNCYSTATNIPRAEVEGYAAQIKQQFLEHDWSAIASEISYPIMISDVTYNDSADFLDASNGFDGNLDEAFLQPLKQKTVQRCFVIGRGLGSEKRDRSGSVRFWTQICTRRE